MSGTNRNSRVPKKHTKRLIFWRFFAQLGLPPQLRADGHLQLPPDAHEGVRADTQDHARVADGRGARGPGAQDIRGGRVAAGTIV